MPYMTFLTKCLHVTIVLISASQTARKDGWTKNEQQTSRTKLASKFFRSIKPNFGKLHIWSHNRGNICETGCFAIPAPPSIIRNQIQPRLTPEKKTSYNTHTHPFSGPLSRTTWVSRYQKGKTNLDFNEARDSEWQQHQLGHTQVCTSLQTDNHASTLPLTFIQAGCPSCRPTNSIKALKTSYIYKNCKALVVVTVVVVTP